MSLIPGFFGRRSSVFDPFSLDVWDPVGAFNSSFNRDMVPSSEFAKDAALLPIYKLTARRLSMLIFSRLICQVGISAGLKKEEVKIEVEDGQILQISGERNKEEEQKNEKYHRVERSRGKFLRRFRLPENAKVEEVKAAMENGVLTVTVQKQPEPKPYLKSIEISD